MHVFPFKAICFVLALICLSPLVNAQSKVQVNIAFSKLYATYAFVQNLSEYYPNNAYKELYNASEYNTAENKALIAQFDTLNIYNSYEFQLYPKGSKTSGMTSSLLMKNLIASENMSEFKNRSFGIIPTEELSAFTIVIERFLPIYDTLVFEKNKEVFHQKMKSLTNYVDSIDISRFFNKSLSFYGSSWDVNVPFDIVMIPTINKGGFTATAFLNNAASEIPLDFPHYDVLFSVLLHEIDHILYDEESAELKWKLENWFNANPSNNSRYAYLLLNEVLATALGNGYVYEVINGELDQQDWYNFKYINEMAKAIYPTIKSYLEDNKSIDKAFVDKYIALYDERFSDWSNELDNLFTNRYLISDNMEADRFFRTNYQYASKRYLEVPLSYGAIQKMMETPVTKIVIVTENHKKNLSLLSSAIPELAAQKLRSKKEFVKVIDLEDRTKLFIVNCHDEDIERMLSRYFSSGRIPK